MVKRYKSLAKPVVDFLWHSQPTSQMHTSYVTKNCLHMAFKREGVLVDSLYKIYASKLGKCAINYMFEYNEIPNPAN